MTHRLQGSEIRAWREANKLTQDDLAELLSLARPWISKIENGKVPVSADVFLKFRELQRNPKFTAGAEGAPTTESVAYLAEAPLADTAASMIREIESNHTTLVAAAGRDLARLGWILIQQQTHLNPPAEWIQPKAEPAPKKPLVGKVPLRHQNPIQPGRRSDSDRASA